MILLIVTCGGRGSKYLGNLVEQVNQSRWPGTCIIISDGPSSLATGWPTFASQRREGQTKTYWRALAVGLDAAQRSGSDRIVILEDDVELSQNALQYMEQIPLPKALDFVTWFDGHAVPPGSGNGIHPVDAYKFFCLQAISWKPSTAERLLRSPAVRAWGEQHAGDNLIAQILSDRRYGVHVPNLVQHMGAASLCNPGQRLTGVRTANNYRGRTFDAMTLVSGTRGLGVVTWVGAPQQAIPPKPRLVGKNGNLVKWTLEQINRSDINPTAKASGEAAIADPSVSVYKGQRHIAYRVSSGGVEDCWFDGRWQKQTIDLGNGYPCQVGPSIGVHGDQQHFVVVSGPPAAGSLWDAWYDSRGTRSVQQLNMGGRTDAAPAAYEASLLTTDRVSVWTWDNEQHFTYRTGAHGSIIDVCWNGSEWQQQTLNTAEGLAGNTSGAPAVGDPYACVFRPNAGPGQQHVAYRDAKGTIVDCWYDPMVGPEGTWKSQTINAGGSPAVSGPIVWTTTLSLYGGGCDQALHFAYVDANGTIWDSYYDGGWKLVQVNASDNANSPPAVGGLSACVFFELRRANQSHIVYRAAGGAIWDCWHDYATNSWGSSQVNLGAQASADAVGDPVVWAWARPDGSPQLHVTYRAAEGVIWDAFWVLPPEQLVGGHGKPSLSPVIRAPSPTGPGRRRFA
jgi:hypothetical protein